MRDYTDFQDVIASKNAWLDYVWGPVQAVHRIGDYVVIEHIVKSGTGKGETSFHPVLWTDAYSPGVLHWEDTNNGYGSLEAAIVGVIAYRFDGLNSQAAGYFCKMIGLNE